MTARRSSNGTSSRLHLTAEAFLVQRVRALVEPVFEAVVAQALADVRARLAAQKATRPVAKPAAKPAPKEAPKPAPKAKVKAPVEAKPQPVPKAKKKAKTTLRATQVAFDFGSEPHAPEPSEESLVDDPEALLAAATPVSAAVAAAAARTMGSVKWFDPARGYGFLTSTTGEDAFVHCTAFASAMPDRPQGGFRVSYERSPGKRGLQALDVRPA